MINGECRACWEYDGFALNEDGYCEEVCGDGIWMNITHECDDGNNDDGDGCSGLCFLEYGYACSDGKSCREVIPPTISSVSIRRPNVVVLDFEEEIYVTSEGKPPIVLSV